MKKAPDKQPNDRAEQQTTDDDHPTVRWTIGSISLPKLSKEQQAAQGWRKGSVFGKELDA